MITILTGPAAAGKNTIGHLYAARFSERCALIDVDVVRGMLRQPHVAPWDGTEGLRQHRLGVHHACLLAESFVREGYETLILYVLWNDLAQQYRTTLADFSVRIVRLLPTWGVCVERLHARPHSITDDEARWVYDTQVMLQNFDITLDNSNISAENVAKWLKTGKLAEN